MNAKYISLGLVTAAGVVSALAADPITSMDWQFGTSDNPSAASFPVGGNPFGASATATVDPGTAGLGYYEGAFDAGGSFPGGYGTLSGGWDILNGSVTLAMDLMPATPTTLLNYTLTLNQYVSNGNVPYTVTVLFSEPNAQLVNTVNLEGPTVDGGTWVQTTYQWDNLSVSGPVGLTFSSDAGKGLLLDRVQFNVTGSLVAIPEPTTSQLGFVGLAILGFLSWRRSKATV